PHRRQRVALARGGRAPQDPEWPAAGLRLRRRVRRAAPPRLGAVVAVAMRFPVLSVITWSPFIGALLIMFLARHRPLLVRLIAVVTTGISAALSLWIYVAYEREAAGFQFYEKVALVPPLGISYELGVDGMSLLMVLLTSVIF